MRQVERIRSTLSIFAISLSILMSNAGGIQAELARSSVRKVRFIQPPLISNARNLAGRQRGAASRGSCPTVNPKLPLTAIVPATLIGETLPGVDPSLTTWQSVGGLTSLPNPSLLFYVPDELSKFTKEFVLQDESGKNIYKTSLTPSSTHSNVIQQGISPTAVTLKPGKVYQWFFVVNCAPDATPYVQGWIQRVTLNPSLKNQLRKATLPQQADLYAANGIWYDALAALAEGRRANPQEANLLSTWVSLLDSVGLAAIAYEPIYECCQPKASNSNHSKPIAQ